MTESGTVRVRFAPSPTGSLHLGGARTALFNWLYARHTHGRFVLRIEDTDPSRNTPEALRKLLDGLIWLGLDWDEGPQPDGGSRGAYGPYFQSQRRHLYEEYTEKLLSSGKAYEEKGAVKFRMPRKPIVVEDKVCGRVLFEPQPDPDFVLRRQDGSFVFHLVNVVDDLLMEISHVIRGEDHLSNTPKHLALFEALEAKAPVYAHIPLILNEDGSKMSKRDVGASLEYYIQEGYLPEAVRNYLCLLGWSLGDNREIFPIEEAIARFDLSRIHRANARLDRKKLYWMNGEYMRASSVEALVPHALRWLEAKGLTGPHTDPTYIQRVVGLIKDKVKIGKELCDWAIPFFRDDFSYEEESVQKILTPEGLRALARLLPELEQVQPFTAGELEARFRRLASLWGVPLATLVHPVRLAVTGRAVGPSLFPMLEVLGQKRVVERVARTLQSFGPA
jgi:nondiscriminating glutamyl-tRNA synthetase